MLHHSGSHSRVFCNDVYKVGKGKSNVSSIIHRPDVMVLQGCWLMPLEQHFHLSRFIRSVTYKDWIFKEGGKDCCNFLALETSSTTKVYWYLLPLTLNLVCLKGLPLDLVFLLTLTTADLMSALLANSTNSLMSLISF